jgi:hypothetical protein
VPVKCILTCISSCCSLSGWRAGLWFLAALEGLDDAHLASAIGAWLLEGEWDDLGNWRVFLRDHLRAK